MEHSIGIVVAQWEQEGTGGWLKLDITVIAQDMSDTESLKPKEHCQYISQQPRQETPNPEPRAEDQG